ncbi:MAG: thermonuclease family protein [Fuerstiella sp.]
MKNIPIAFLTLLAGCTEQPPGLSRVADRDPIVESQTPVVDQPGIGQQLYKVIKIVHGDTIYVLTDDKETIRLRFNGIDTPERGQPFGNNATKFVSDTVGGKMVRLVTHGEDRYDRTIADIYLPIDIPNLVVEDLFLNGELVKRGLAWHYKYYSDDKRLADAENNARLKKLGLWGGSHKVIAPWDWRKLSKDERDEFR